MRFLLGQPLLADLTELLIGLAVLIMAVLKQLYEANKQAGAKRAAAPDSPQQQQPQAQARAQKPAPQAGQQADPLRNQVEEFLRRAGKNPQSENRPAPQQRPSSEIEVLIEEGRRSLTEANRPDFKLKPLKPDPKRAARRSVTPKRRVTLAERATAREEVRVGKLPEQPPHLGRRIIEEDKQFDEQLKAKFDHTVGTLGVSTAANDSTAPPPQVESPAAQIAAMLANPGGVRQAMVLNEILNRPSDRW